MWLLIASIAAVLGTSFACSLMESVLLSVTIPYIHLLQKKKRRSGALLAQQKKEIEKSLAAILTLNTIANTAGASIVGAIALSLFGSRWIAVVSAGFTLAILIFSEIIPKTIGTYHWKTIAPFIAWPLRIISILLKPILVIVDMVAKLIPGKNRESVVSRAEVEALVKIGQHEGTFNEAEYRMVSGVVRLDDTRVGEVMTPRTEMVAMPIEASLEEIEQRVVESGHLRMPIYRGSLDHIVGIVLGRKLWKARLSGESDLSEIMIPPRFVPESKPIDDLIGELRKERMKMAIVVDEYGGTAGLVTLEDLLEEVVGEIHDEHEVAKRDFQEVPEGLLVAGQLSIRQVAEKLKEEIPDDEYDTIGGFVFGLLGHLPQVNDEVAWKDYLFRVSAVDGRRISRIVIRQKEEDS